MSLVCSGAVAVRKSVSLLQGWDIAQEVLVCSVGHLSHLSRMGHCAGSPGLQCGPSVSPFKDGTLRRKSSSAVWATCLTFQGWDIAQDVFVCSGVTVGQLSHPSRTRHDEIAESVPLFGLLGSHSGPHSPPHPFQDGALWRMLRHSVFQTRVVLTVNMSWL